ncbi:phospholipase D/nuclease [Aspergillus sclerotioniger CBS 115572]|uniref:Phospholipase D/nuclease n=1 Tax=Aspergillus sclerotioniger CBS 115572 TaxID=1450535 RepID=A0A317W2Z5_9EURO|nr:phospholipase D/nuclease [Aspergillus sclerotioniger CBS 115572]PWY80966.1 phospholipase D/nuclease [Aspergillus sclerotioniger CBS 115572]
MSSDDLLDADLRAAISASLAEAGHQSEQSSRPRSIQFVDLTADSDSDDDDIIPVFPKSRSVIGSDTEEEDYEDDDEALRAAIALSIQEAGGQISDINSSGGSESTSSEASQSTDSEDGESQDTDSPSVTEVEARPSSQEPARPMGILGLDRRQMEEERLARLAKRKAQDTTLADQRPTKQSRTNSASKTSVSEPKRATRYVTTSPSQAGSSSSTPSSSPSIQFPEGVVKKTWAFGSLRQGDDIKIGEVFQKSDLQLAVLSSYMWEMEWLFSKMDIGRTRFILMMQAEDDAKKRQYESETAYMPNLRLCFPPMDGQVNCMHSKLMLLFHPGYLRIVIPTANLVPFDWGEEKGVMENTVFLIDLPEKRNTLFDGQPKTSFYEELVYFLEASTLHDNIVAKLDGFDFSKTSKFAFVHSIGGTHTRSRWKRTGYCGLGSAIEKLGLRTSSPINVDFVSSSLGAITDELLRTIYLASQGDNGLTDFTLRTAKKFPAPRRDDSSVTIKKETAAEWKDRFRIYFPSQATVNSSKGGSGYAGTVCFQSKWFESVKFPRHVLRDCKSQREGLLMHNKILYVRPDDPISLSDTTQCRAWAYVGSANMSESAWGRLVQDRATKTLKINCRNWECGVLVPIIEDKKSGPSPQNEHKGSETTKGKGKAPASSALSDDGANLVSVFGDTVPVPMQVPGERYQNGQKPWFFMEM